MWDSNEAHHLNLDAQGWVRGFTQSGGAAPFQNIATVWAAEGAQMRAGNYVIDWKGEGTLDVGGATIVSRSGNRIVVDPGPQANWLTISSTDPNKTGNYIRDIRIYHESDKALLDAGEIFNPAFLDKIEDFRSLRFMDWMDTNNSAVRSWGDTTQPGEASQSSYDKGTGASVDMMVALANKVDADPWFTIPHGADANYIRQFATYVRDHLDPNLKAHFEYSNEVWNWAFDQAQWAQAQAVSTWGAGVQGGWMQWYGVKAAEMARIVASVYGNETGTRALNVFATQSGWQGLEQYALNAPDHVARGGTAPKDAPFHVYAIAPYFGGGVAHMAAQVRTWASQGEAGMKAALAWLGQDINALASTVAYHSGIAQRMGWQLEGYEGGQHLVEYSNDATMTRFLTALADRPEMAQLYNQYFTMWKDNGGGMLAHYSDFGAGDRYGSWGIWDSAYSGDTPRASAVEAFRDSVEAWWNDNRPDSVFNGGGGTATPPTNPTQPTQPTQPTTPGNPTAGADVLRGTAGADSLNGLAGDDQIQGDGGNDTLLGDGGQDRLDGGTDDDRLDGGTGNDQLTGSTG
ncbi:calcium-binding protein, partial [Rubellimicrobium rubrum]